MDLKSYYQTHQRQLEEAYPGLKWERLLYEFEVYQKQGGNEEGFIKKISEALPLAYITGLAPFYKHEFFVNSHVLIPRSETEILVEMGVKALKEMFHKGNLPTVVDVGTGSGAIILSLLCDCPFRLKAFGIDLSYDALHVAQKNKERLENSYHPQSELKFVQGDRLNDFPYKADLIVSNPPYIKRRGDRAKVHFQVLKYEPEMALFLDDVSYDEWFSLFFSQVYNSLEEGGFFIMEGHEDHLLDLMNLAEGAGLLAVSVHKDYTGRNRFLTARK